MAGSRYRKGPMNMRSPHRDRYRNIHDDRPWLLREVANQPVWLVLLLTGLIAAVGAFSLFITLN